MKNKDWVDLIAKEFSVSKSIAKDMLDAMCEVREHYIDIALHAR